MTRHADPPGLRGPTHSLTLRLRRSAGGLKHGRSAGGGGRDGGAEEEGEGEGEEEREDEDEEGGEGEEGDGLTEGEDSTAGSGSTGDNQRTDGAGGSWSAIWSPPQIAIWSPPHANSAAEGAWPLDPTLILTVSP